MILLKSGVKLSLWKAIYINHYSFLRIFMPNLLVYIKRGIQRKIKVNYLKLKEIPDFLLVSPGGCGSVSLIKYLCF